jgi:osmotically-inducible protein OsmY
MTKLTLTLITAAGLALAGTTTLACASTSKHESTGEYLDNSVITAKVKAAILNDPALKSLQINVKTYKDVVQLSGFVDSAASVRRAGEVAADVKGVSKVTNDLLVK